MTHDELLAKIDEGSRVCEIDSIVWQALRAVVERHHPEREDEWKEGYYECAECSVGDVAIKYPCNTIKDVTKELK